MNTRDPGNDPVASYLQRYGGTAEVQSLQDPESEFNRVRYAKSLSPTDRLSAALGRGMVLGGSLGFAGRDDVEDPNPGHLDATDVASAAGQLIGGLPAAILSAGVMNPLTERLAASSVPFLSTAARAVLPAVGRKIAPRVAAAGARQAVQMLPLHAVEVGREIAQDDASLGDVARNVGLGLAADVVTGGLTHGRAPKEPAPAPGRARLSSGGAPRQLPAGRYEMGGAPLDETPPLPIEERISRPAVDVDAELVERPQLTAPAARLAIPATAGPEGPVQTFGPEAGVSTFVSGPEGVTPITPPARQIPSRTGGPVLTPPPAGAVLDPNRVDRLASGAVNRVMRTPPPPPVAPVPTEVAARLAAEPELPMAPEPEIPAPIASRLATPPVPEERLAAPEPPAPVGPVAPRFRSRAATAYADEAVRAQEPSEVMAIMVNAATDPKAAPDRVGLIPFLQQRMEELGGIPKPVAREAPPPRPKPPAPAPAEGGLREPAPPAPAEPPTPTPPSEIGPGALVTRVGRMAKMEVVGPVTKENGPNFRGKGWIVRRPNGEEVMIPEKELELATAPKADAVAPPSAPEPAPYTPGERVAGAEGAETSVAFPDNSRVKARYRVVEAGDIQPSHDPLSFQRNPRFPEDVQGRDYHRDLAAQENVATSTAALDPERLLDPTINVGAGAPLVTPDGIAVAGNQRSMMLQRAATHNPEATARYRAMLEERAPQFGLDPEAVRGMQNPVLVREIADEGLDLSDRATLRDLNTRSDQEVGKVKDVLSDAATRARAMTADSPALHHLSETMGTDETLRGYLRGSSGRQFVSRLIEEGVIGKNEVPKFIDAKTNGVTEEGAQVIERTLLAAAVGDADVVGRAPAGALAKLEHAVPAIIRTGRIEGFNIGVGLRDALDLLAEKQAGGFRSLDDLLGQGDLLNGPRDVPAVTRRLAEFLDSAKPSEVKAAFRGLLADAEEAGRGFVGDMFGGEPKTFSESFRDRFKGSGQRLGDEFGFALAHTMTGALGGLGGAAYGFTQGDTTKDRIQNATLYGSLGLAVGILGARGAEGVLELARTEERGSLRKMVDHIFKDGTDWMRTLGASGSKLAGDVEVLARRVEQRVGTDMEDLHRALKNVAKSERPLLGKIMNRRPIPELENKIPRRLMDKVTEVRAILDRSMKEFGEVGGVRRNLEGESLGAPKGSGKAFPQVPNEAGRDFLKEATLRKGASPRVAALAERMVKRGEAVDFEDAVDRIIQYANRSLRGVTGYLESTRFELPEEYVEWDPTKVLPGVIEKSWRTVEGFRLWGKNMDAAKKLIARVGNEAGADQQVKLETWFSHTFGAAGRQDRASAKILGAISNYESLSKLGFSLFSILRNAGQIVTNTSDLPWQAQLKAFRDLPPVAHAFMKSAAAIKEELRRAGVVSNRSVLSELENRAPLHHISNVAMKGFLSVEGMNQYRTALAARYTLERDLTDLARLKDGANPVEKVWTAVRALSLDPEGAVARRIERMAPTADQAKEWLSGKRPLTEDEIQAVMWKANNDRNFAANLATEHIWWSTSPAARLWFKFKRFGIKQAGYIWNHVAKEAAAGNVAPLTKFILATMVVGEAYHAARDLVLGEDKSVTGALLDGKAIGGRILGDIKDGGAFGFTSDLLWGVGDYVGGPALTSFSAGTRAIANAIRRPGDPKQWALAGADFIRRDVSVTKQAEAVYQRGVKTLDDSNRYFEATKLRHQARAFGDKQKSVGEKLQAGAIKMVEGLHFFPDSDRTLVYRYAAKQVDVGDTGDAATYLTGLIRDAKPGEERNRVIDGMYASMEAQSPLGSLNAEEEGKFLRSLPARERSEARALDRAWRRNYERAVNQAIRQARR